MAKNKKHIVLAVTNDLVTDQRVDRSCRALAEAGYAVTLVGRRLPESPQLKSRSYRTQRMRLLFRRSALFYAEYNLRLLLKLLLVRADAFYANDTDTLLACCWAARLRGKRLIFDAHELFPEVPELVDKPRVRKVWQWVERTCLPRVDAAFTVCQSVAEEYHRRYGVEMAVVRNLSDYERSSAQSPADSTASDRPVRTLLYQGAVNVGRGLRELVDAMELLSDCRLLVAGNGDLLAELKAYTQTLPWSGRITFLGRVEPARLHLLTQTADLGVCLLEDLGLNYRYALPNRVADFAHAGVPLLATDFVEIRRVIATYQTGALIGACPREKSGEAYRHYVRQLAETINDTLLYWHQLPAAEKAERFGRACRDLNWQSEKKVLTQKIDTII